MKNDIENTQDTNNGANDMKQNTDFSNIHIPYFTITASIIFIAAIIFLNFSHKIIFLLLALLAIFVYLSSLAYSYNKTKSPLTKVQDASKEKQKIEQNKQPIQVQPPKRREYRMRWLN